MQIMNLNQILKITNFKDFMQTKKLYKSKEKRIAGIPSKESFNPPLIDHPRVVYYIYIPIIIALFLYSTIFLYIKLWQYLVCFTGAIIFWTVFEYALHRYVLHANPKSKILQQILYKTHWVHHEYPNDNRFVLMSPLVSLLGGVVFYVLCLLIFGPVFCYPVLMALVSIYVAYEWMHFAAHNYHFNNRLFKKLKKHHLLHHFKDNEKGFGFITTQWDELTGTDFKD